MKTVESHMLDTGHFALEEDSDEIAQLITCFMAQHTDFLNKYPEFAEICKLAA